MCLWRTRVRAWKNQLVENSRNKEGYHSKLANRGEYSVVSRNKEGYTILCSTAQVNFLRHRISKTLWIRHHPYIWQHLWLSRGRLGVQVLSASTCSRYLARVYNKVHGSAKQLWMKCPLQRAMQVVPEWTLCIPNSSCFGQLGSTCQCMGLTGSQLWHGNVATIIYDPLAKSLAQVTGQSVHRLGMYNHALDLPV